MSDLKWEGDKPLTISNSEIQTWKSCKRKWWLTYYRELGFKRENEAPVGARQLGSRVHLALELMYRSDENPIEVLNDIYAEDAQLLADSNRDDLLEPLKKEQDLARAMIEGYIDWVREEAVDEGMTFVEAEAVVEVNSAIPGVKLRGKLDQRWERKSDGARLFRDFKTVAEFNTPKQILPMDEQMKFYHLLEFLSSLQETGKEPKWRTDGALYTMLRKVKRTATAKPPFYEQVEVHHNMTELRNMYARVNATVEEMVKARQRMDSLQDVPVDKDQPEHHQTLFPPRPSRDCTWSCDFVTVCHMFDDGSNAEGLLKEYYTHIDPHERYKAQDQGRKVTE